MLKSVLAGSNQLPGRPFSSQQHKSTGIVYLSHTFASNWSDYIVGKEGF